MSSGPRDILKQKLEIYEPQVKFKILQRNSEKLHFSFVDTILILNALQRTKLTDDDAGHVITLFFSAFTNAPVNRCH